jgi:hypothetical protein
MRPRPPRSGPAGGVQGSPARKRRRPGASWARREKWIRSAGIPAAATSAAACRSSELLPVRRMPMSALITGLPSHVRMGSVSGVRWSLLSSMIETDPGRASSFGYDRNRSPRAGLGAWAVGRDGGPGGVPRRTPDCAGVAACATDWTIDGPCERNRRERLKTFVGNTVAWCGRVVWLAAFAVAGCGGEEGGGTSGGGCGGSSNSGPPTPDCRNAGSECADGYYCYSVYSVQRFDCVPEPHNVTCAAGYC